MKFAIFQCDYFFSHVETSQIRRFHVTLFGKGLQLRIVHNNSR